MLSSLHGSLPVLLALGSLALAAPAQRHEVSVACGDPSSPQPWLEQQQAEDGHWPGDGQVGDVGTTALVLTAYAGDGNLPRQGPLAERMRKGLQWLLAQQDATSGVFGASLEAETPLLEHAWSTLLVSEVAYLAREQAGVGDANARAARALLAVQRADGSFGSARATGWSAFALVSARESGVDVPAEALLRARAALTSSVATEGPAEDLDFGALALRTLIGFLVDDGSGEGDAAAIAALGRVVALEGLWTRLDPEQRMLLAYAAYQIGGKTWQTATRGMKATVLPRRIQVDGENHGGFPAEQGFGPVRATAFGALTLEVYYRYARILGAR